MAEITPVKIEDVLNSFAELMSSLMIEQYQKHLAELDLTLPQAQVLRVLRRGPVTTGQLASELKISAPAITQLTDRLKRKGLVERNAAVDDRRCVIIMLSADGRRLVDQFRRRRSQVFSNALTQLSADEQAQIVLIMRKVIGALESYTSNIAAKQSEKLGSTGKKRRKL